MKRSPPLGRNAVKLKGTDVNFKLVLFVSGVTLMKPGPLIDTILGLPQSKLVILMVV